MPRKLSTKAAQTCFSSNLQTLNTLTSFYSESIDGNATRGKLRNQAYLRKFGASNSKLQHAVESKAKCTIACSELENSPHIEELYHAYVQRGSTVSVVAPLG